MKIETTTAVERLALALEAKGLSGTQAIAEKAIWLEACGYPGLKTLGEALADEERDLAIVRTALGLDLKNISCVYIAEKIADYINRNGRTFLRNVRHGLYLLPDSVENNYGIGCPVDPSFALGGDRTKDPYAEKLEAAAKDGIDVDDAVWAGLVG